MTRYKNLSGNSGVAEYEAGRDFVKVRFKDDTKVYVYTIQSAGPTHVNAMNRLAAIGRGLATYIAQNVRDLYDRIE